MKFAIDVPYIASTVPMGCRTPCRVIQVTPVELDIAEPPDVIAGLRGEAKDPDGDISAFATVVHDGRPWWSWQGEVASARGLAAVLVRESDYHRNKGVWTRRGEIAAPAEPGDVGGEECTRAVSAVEKAADNLIVHGGRIYQKDVFPIYRVVAFPTDDGRGAYVSVVESTKVADTFGKFAEYHAPWEGGSVAALAGPDFRPIEGTKEGFAVCDFALMQAHADACNLKREIDEGSLLEPLRLFAGDDCADLVAEFVSGLPDRCVIGRDEFRALVVPALDGLQAAIRGGGYGTMVEACARLRHAVARMENAPAPRM